MNRLVYPCNVLNGFACPYGKKIVVVAAEEDITRDSITKNSWCRLHFYLSEPAFVVELALAKAQEEDSGLG